jgi:hypothetical protein
VQGPGGEADHRGAGPQGEGDLGEGAEPASDGDQSVAGTDQEQVAALAHAGGDRDAEVGVAAGAVEPGKEADRGAPGRHGAAADRLHDAATAAAHHHRAALGQPPAEELALVQ